MKSKKSVLLSLALTMVCACADSNVTDSRSLGQSTGPDRGIYISGEVGSLTSGLLSKSLDVPGVDGLLINMPWRDIASPTIANVYDWTKLDAFLELARSKNKKVQLAFSGGKDAPDWLLTPAPNGLGLPGYTFQHSSHATDAACPIRCNSLTIARPWEPALISAFGNMLRQLSIHLRAENYYETVSMLRISGGVLNVSTDEMRLPVGFPTANSPDCFTIDARKVWKQAGFKPSKIVAAWNQILLLFNENFPDKSFSFALIAKLAFPAIREDGVIVKTPSVAGEMSDALTASLISAASKALKDRLVLQKNYLIRGGTADKLTVEQAQLHHLPMAFQANNGLRGERPEGGSACGGSSCVPVVCANSDEYFQLLNVGIHPIPGDQATRSKYLEIFPPDAPQFPDAVLKAHRILSEPI